jgi:predicted  nucleic acid-binding Zn-ribbon protein
MERNAKRAELSRRIANLQEEIHFLEEQQKAATSEEERKELQGKIDEKRQQQQNLELERGTLT